MPLAGRGGQRHVVDRAADQLGVAGAELVEQREPALEVRERAALLDLGGDLARDRFLGRARDRPVGARVEVRDALEDRELGAQRGQGHGRAA